MAEVIKHAAEVAKLALVHNDLVVVGPKEGEKRPYDSEVYTTSGKLGFETISRTELENSEKPDLSAFEGSPRRHIRDKLVTGLTDLSPQAGRMATTLLEKKLMRTTEPFALDHTLGHLRHPDLYLTVGPPMYDTVLVGHIAQTAALALEHGNDTTREENRARVAQVDRWRRRFATRGEDWYGKLLKASEITKKLIQTGGNFADTFPIDAQQPVDLRYGYGDKGNELVVHNVRLLREFAPDALTDKVGSDEQVRRELSQGLVLTRDVLKDSSHIPDLPALTESLDMYMSYCDRMRSLVGQNGDIEALSQQQVAFDEAFKQYTGVR